MAAKPDRLCGPLTAEEARVLDVVRARRTTATRVQVANHLHSLGLIWTRTRSRGGRVYQSDWTTRAGKRVAALIADRPTSLREAYAALRPKAHRALNRESAVVAALDAKETP